MSYSPAQAIKSPVLVFIQALDIELLYCATAMYAVH
jgi:hypothetical protein